MQLLLYPITASPQLPLPSTALKQKEVILPLFPIFQSPDKSNPLPGMETQRKINLPKATCLFSEITGLSPGGIGGFHFIASLLWIRKKSSKYQLDQNPKSSCYSSAFKLLKEKTCGSASLCNSMYYSCNNTCIIITCYFFCCQEQEEASNSPPLMLRPKYTGGAK